MKKEELTVYRDLLGDIKTRVRQAQHRAALSANAEMILLYWDIGRMIAARQIAEGWGAGVIPRLATDLKNELPEEKGFSERNIKRMLRFYQEYSAEPSKVPQAVAQLESTDLKQTPVGQGPVVKLPATMSEIGLYPALQSEHKSIETKMPQSVAQSNTIFMLPIVQRSIAQLPWGHNILLFEKIKHLPTRLWYA